MPDDNEHLVEAYTTVFDGLEYLGPADGGTTQKLIDRLREELRPKPLVADFGCGVGASALRLAETLPEGRVLALDLYKPFIDRLQASAVDRGLDERIDAVTGDMAAPPPLDGIRGDFDLIWCESAIYVLGRATAFIIWRELLRPDGWLVFSDLVWQLEPSQRAPTAIEFWRHAYPDLSEPNAVLTELAEAGFAAEQPAPVGRTAWPNYYEPLRLRLRRLAQEPDHSLELDALIAELQQEIGVYDQFGDHVAPVFFLARWSPEP